MTIIKDLNKFVKDTEKNISKAASTVGGGIKKGFESKEFKSAVSTVGGGISSATGSVTHGINDVYKDALRPAVFGTANIVGDTANNLNKTLSTIGGSSFLVPVIGLVAVAFILNR